MLGSHKATGIYRGGKYSSYEGGTRVPCILRWTGMVKPGVSNSLMSQVDWFASLASLCNVNLPDGAAPDSENNLSSWLNMDKKGRKMVVEQNLQNNLSITDGEWKYIPASEGPIMNKQTNTELGNNSVDQLYNLLSDPGEQKNVSEKNGKRVKGMSAELKRIIESGIHYKVLR